MKDWADFRAVKEAVSLEAVLRHYQVAGLRRRRDQLAGRFPSIRGHAMIPSAPIWARLRFAVSLARPVAMCWSSWPPWRSAPYAMRRSGYSSGLVFRGHWDQRRGRSWHGGRSDKQNWFGKRNRTTPRSGSHCAVWIPITRTWNTGDSRVQPPSSSASVSMAGPAC